MASQADRVAEAHKTLYDQGLAVRTDVTGADHVHRSLQNGSSDFARPMQELATEVGWGSIWTRPGLDRKTRSLLNIAMLCALNRMTELAVHVRGAVNNGASEIEIRETLIQVAGYCGLPAGLEGVRVAERVLDAIREQQSGEKSSTAA
ncbi:4-carboxymuconolactone decarboxylase [Capronia epimyces CBS 606.96]|uniref:4-carboxymuconolactone decarboxylase n=1 Tax=Capronia epimyces CBS 606.96 TaxID=1182542 RepID=W9XHD7_9EURO|nr:4-carboxymuconolactone decarboxylase [Capronia epimyces CBS 606.96]EXJ79917.1 4-carboxymuconolactone decarboxylase [Capronia epimyces CBS 606.96]